MPKSSATFSFTSKYKYIFYTAIQHPLFETINSWESSQVIHILPLLPCTHLKSCTWQKVAQKDEGVKEDLQHYWSNNALFKTY